MRALSYCFVWLRSRKAMLAMSVGAALLAAAPAARTTAALPPAGSVTGAGTQASTATAPSTVPATVPPVTRSAAPASAPGRGASGSALPAVPGRHRPAAAPRAVSGPTLKSSYAGFTDVNGNGVLDCGEPVDLVATFATNNSGTPALTGSLFVPAAGSAGLSFLHGSVVIDPDLTNGCMGTVVLGNGPDDTDARIDYSCPADPIDNEAWTLVVRYRAAYVGTGAPSFTAAAQADTSDGASYRDAVTVAAGSSCGGVPTAIAVGKSAAGPATPGSRLVYTITATDQSGAGAGGLQVVEAVPTFTTFSAAGSSPGWVCSPDGSAGSLCRNPVGNLSPDGTLTTFFAVTVAAALPPAPVVIANTACVRLGPTVVAGCASLATPAGGTPVLHLAKSLASGSGVPGTAVVYSLAAANTGNQGLADAVIQETVPALTTFSAGGSSPGWSCADGAAAGTACTLDLGPLGAGAAAAARTFAVTVEDPLPSLPPGSAISNTACLSAGAAGAGAGGAASSCSTVSIPTAGTPMLHTVKTLVSGTAVPGGTLVYDLAVQNTGNAAAAVGASEVVPANTTFAAIGSDPGWVCTPAAGAAGASCTAPAGVLAAGATAHLRFAVTVAKPLAAGVIAVANTACFAVQAVMEAPPGARSKAGAKRGAGGHAILAGPPPPAAAPPSCDTLSTPTQGAPLITIEKVYNGPPAAAGALLTFGLSAANTGNQDAAAVTLTETVPAHTTFVAAASSAGWSCSPSPGGAGAAGAACSLAAGPLAAGASVAAGFAVRADAPLPAGVRQIANIACAAAAGLAPACSQAVTPAPPGTPAVAAEMDYAFLRNALGNGLATEGDVIQYSLVVTNPGTATALGLYVVVPLDTHLTLNTGSVTTTAGTVAAGNAAGEPTPAVKVPSLAAGASVTIVFATTVGPLPAALQELATQATLTGTNFAATVSSDPRSPVPLTPTTTPVGHLPPQVFPVPTLGSWGLAALAAALAATCLGRMRFNPAPRPEGAGRPFDGPDGLDGSDGSDGSGGPDGPDGSDGSDGAAAPGEAPRS